MFLLVYRCIERAELKKVVPRFYPAGGVSTFHSVLRTIENVEEDGFSKPIHNKAAAIF